MALTLSQSAQLVASPGFNARVRAAMLLAAMNVSTETQGSLGNIAWIKRQQLAARITTSPDAYLPAFVGLVAADPGRSLVWYQPILITSSTQANPSVLTTPAHSLATGDVVEIVGHLVNTSVNGTWPVTVLSATTFSIPQPGIAAGGATGTMQKQIDDTSLNFTVNSTAPTNVFSAVAGIAHGE
jgi:hypothetical protein